MNVKAWLAAILTLGLVGLPDADLFGAGELAWKLVAMSLVLAIAAILLASPERRQWPSRGEVIYVALLGGVCSGLFWFRAWLVPPTGFLAELQLQLPAVVGWAWPGLLLASLYRRPGEGWRPGSRRRQLGLTGVALVAGLVGFVAYLAAWSLWGETLRPERSASPLHPGAILARPTATPQALALLGGPRELRLAPHGVVFVQADDRSLRPRALTIEGRYPAGLVRDIGHAAYGTRATSSRPAVVRVVEEEDGGWTLQPGVPGHAVIRVTHRDTRAYAGVWTIPTSRSPMPVEEVTAAFSVEPGEIEDDPDGPFDGFYRQRLMLHNRSGEPQVGPLYVLFEPRGSGEWRVLGEGRTLGLEPLHTLYMTLRPPDAAPFAPPATDVIRPGARIELSVRFLNLAQRPEVDYGVRILRAFQGP